MGKIFRLEMIFVDRKKDFQIGNNNFTLEGRFLYWQKDFQVGNATFILDTIF